VLVIEDSKTDVFLIREALRSAGVRARIDVVHDGKAALQLLEQGPPPALLLLDLNLPKYGGREVLRRLRTDARTKDMSVLVVTSSALSQDRDREELLALRLDGYFQKPSKYTEFLELGPLVKGLLERGK